MTAVHLLDAGWARMLLRDLVSGLPKRRAFEGMLERELVLGERTGSSLCVVFLDLHGRKGIND